MKVLISILVVLALFTSFVYADSITIDSVNVNPAKIEPGNTTRIDVTLENQGKRDIENVKVSLDLSSPDLPFAPLESAAQKIIDEIKDGDNEQISFILMVSPDAKSKIYKIPVIVSYKENDQPIAETSVIGLEVTSKPILEVAIEENEIYKLNQQGEITFRFVNKGLSDIKFLSVKLSKNAAYEILSTDSFYVGNIEPDDFETVSFKLNFVNKVNAIKVYVEYRDNANKLYKKTYSLPITLYTQEEAYKLGLEKKSNPIMYVVIGIAVVILIFVFRRRRKKHIVK